MEKNLSFNGRPSPTLRRAGSGESSRTNGTNGTNGTKSSHPSQNLLFGEIPTGSSSGGSRSSRSNSSVCNLVASSSPTFIRFWLDENCRNAFLANVDRATLPNFRLVCHDFGARAAPYLFEDMTVSFKTNTFSKKSRLIALESIGKHVRRLTFNLPRICDSFLPPLLNPITGDQMAFTYVPQVESTGRNRGPKYGTWEMTDSLIKQYPPLFHAATNIPAFIRAFQSMPMLQNLTIQCLDREFSERHRRSVVDYALISLRIAIERAQLFALSGLNLLSIHPTALMNLQPDTNHGTRPGSGRRWCQIQRLTIEMESQPFIRSNDDEHLRNLKSYLRTYSATLTHLSFRWVGQTKGPSPLSIDAEPEKDIGSPTRIAQETNSQRSRSPRGVRFANLQNLLLENAVMDSSQVTAFIAHHRPNLAEFCFEDVSLVNGDWDSVFEPLRGRHRRRGAGRKRKHHQHHPPRVAIHPDPEDRQSVFMDVPVMLSPVDMPSDPIIEDALFPEDGAGLVGYPEGVGAHKAGIGKWLWKVRNRRAAWKERRLEGHGATSHWRRVLPSSVMAWA